MKYDKNYDGGFQALDENDKEMENDDDSDQMASENDDRVDLKKKKSANRRENTEESNDFENHNGQMDHR